MITVVHVITKLEMGGAQENTLDTCARLDRSTFRVALMFGPGGIYDQQAEALQDTQVQSLDELVRELSPANDLRCLITLTRRIRALYEEHLALGHPPQSFIVHTHSSKAGVLGRFAARAARIPRVVHTIHGFGFYEGQREAARQAFIAAERAAAQATDAFISVSRANLAEGQSRGIVQRRHKRRLIRSGFPLEAYFAAATRKSESRAKLGLEGASDLIVSIANLKPQKDPLTLVAAMAHVLRERPQARLLYAGDGELRAAVERNVKAAALGDRFQLLGWREDVPDLIAAADVVALSSRFEGLPRSAVQAVATQRPFVGTRVDGTPEIIRDGFNGFLVPPRDPRALGQAIVRALIEQPIEPNNRLAVADWDVDTMVRQQEDFYREVIG